jgi:hypothetical protein
MQVSRSGGAWNAVAEGNKATLGPGDAVLLLNLASSGFDNAGTEPVQFIDWRLMAGDVEVGPPSMPAEWVIAHIEFSEASAVALTGDPSRLRLQRVVLAPRAEFRPPPGAVLQYGVSPPANPEGTPELSFVGSVTRPDGRPIGNTGDRPVTVYVVTMETTGAPE